MPELNIDSHSQSLLSESVPTLQSTLIPNLIKPQHTNFLENVNISELEVGKNKYSTQE